MTKTLTNVLWVFLADILVKLVSAPTTFLVATLLNPAEYGTWITLLLLVSYAPIATLGTLEALVKQYPFHVGKGEVATAERIESGVLGSTVLSAAALLIVGLALSVFLPHREGTAGLGRLMLLTSSFTFMSSFSYYRFSARQRFRSVSLIDTGRALLTLVCQVGLTWLWGLTGTVAGFLLAEVIVCVVSWWLCVKQCGRVAVSYDLKLISGLVRIGLPITIIWWVFIIQSSADRLISMWLLGDSLTGFYGLGVSIVSLVILLPITLNRVLYPRVNEKLGQASRERDLRALVMVPSQALSVMMPIAIGLLVIASPFVYKQVLPKYGPGLASAQILLLGSFFVCIVRAAATFLIATNRQLVVLKYILISVSLNVVGNILLVRLGFGIAGIAFGSGLSACILATLVWLAAFKHLGSGRVERIRELGGLYLPYALMLFLLSVYFVVVPDVFADASRLSAALGGLFVIMFSLMLYLIPTVRVRSTGLLVLLNAKLRGEVAP